MSEPTYRPGLLLAGSLALILVLSMTAPTAAAAERPDTWRCDDTELLVCAGVDVGGAVSCELTRTSTETADANCAWTYGQLLGASSPLGLPGEAAFDWSATITTCLTDASLQPISCSAASTGAGATCVWAPTDECIESQGPNPGQTEVVGLQTGQCLSVEITTSGTAEAWTLDQDGELAYAEMTDTGSSSGATCLQNDGR